MNPHAAQPISLSSLLHSLWRHKQLIFQMTQREVVGRYKGSAMGLTWSFLNPVLMLFVYTFVFSVVFKARWGAMGAVEENRTNFAVILFAGMIVHSLFAEVVNRAPSLILGNVNYVKKVIFPLEVLPVISMAAALFHAMVSTAVLLVVYFILNGHVQWTLVYFPLILLPLIILTLGFAWVLASLGVFLRDVGQVVTVFTTVLMFLSPVFFPVSALPDRIQPLMMLNPLTLIIEQTRAALIFGQQPNWLALMAYVAIAIVFSSIGYAWFQKTRRGFADVL